ncbi:PPE family protein [Candidatus Mycobacterium wuenschmannii]|uniref:PPE family protein n=1 Tax=Candidatus Mycobacterium wuenschmannii TaxID=3027808 RepID=A0ABY8VZL0_9MYCO|nr:PPE family protein [Candidatus Mycobacterium wuenschmannii]WIM87608.1 PPE family protein [Candidatus Mycobacterium wuenschmannii]
MVFDFGALPPEINSGKIYAGPGSAPLLAASTAWNALASELQATAAGYASTITELGSSWQGPSSAAAATAAAPYTDWLSTTAAQAEQTAAQAQAAAAAYEAAFAASIPPPVIEANRALLAALVATNFLGVNTPAIAATEAAYAEFWAQDAGAMYAYSGAAGAATRLPAITEAPATTNDSGQASQAASTAQAAAAQPADAAGDLLTYLNSQLTTLNGDITAFGTQLTNAQTAFINSLGIPALTATLPPDVTGGLSSISKVFTALNGSISTFLSGPFSPLGYASGVLRSFYQASISIPSLGVGIQGIGPLLHPAPITGALSPLLHSSLLSGSYSGAGGAETLASVGRAGYIGSLSVPQNWAAATPAVRTVAAEMEASAVDAAPELGLAQPGMFGQTALSSLAGRAIGGTATRVAVGQGYRVPGAVAADEIATTATIIVIPSSAE